VKEAIATVVANELADAEEPETETSGNKEPVADAAKQKFYADFVKRYYALFRAKFEPFRQREEKTLTTDGFDDNFVQSGLRLEAVTASEIDFEKDKADLETLLSTMTSAATEPKVVERLARYKGAKKVAVQRQIRRIRTEYRRGWNSSSTSCDGWYYSPIGCAEQRAVEVPYTVTSSTMEFPKGTQSHSQIFRAMQDRYFNLLEQRRSNNLATADTRRATIEEGNVQGALDLGTALRIFGAFLALMFFFLFIAIERHQRRFASTLPLTRVEDGIAV